MIRTFSILASTALVLLGSTINSGAAVLTGIFPDDATADYAHWDTFGDDNPDTNQYQEYPGPHEPTVAGSFSGISLTPTASGFAPPPQTSGGQLYSGSSLATFTIGSTYNGLSDVETLIFQARMSTGAPGLNTSTFQLTYDGQTISPADFASFDSSTGYYAWQFDLSGYTFATNDFTIAVTTQGHHATLAEARVDISSTNFTGVNLVPEPGSALLAVIAGASVLISRRRRRA